MEEGGEGDIAAGQEKGRDEDMIESEVCDVLGERCRGATQWEVGVAVV